MRSVAVVGSINIDHVLKVEKLPKLGETISSNSYELFEGGKGANQALSLARLGLDVYMFGKVGNDDYGRLLLESLKKSNVNIDNIIIDPNVKTGAAFITVDNKGNNTIVLTSGANGSISIEDIKNLQNKILENDLLLLQMEIPKETVVFMIKMAKKFNKLILLNLAPATEIETDIINKVDYLILNESEMEFLTNLKYTGNNLASSIKLQPAWEAHLQAPL